MDRVKKGFRQAAFMALIFSVLLIPIAYLFGHRIVGIFVKEQEVIDIGYRALRITFLSYWGIWVTTGVTWITTAVVCVARYFQGKWKGKSIVVQTQGAPNSA